MQSQSTAAFTNDNHPMAGRCRSLLAIALLILGAPMAHAALPTAQRNALVDLYNGTKGASWTNKTNWLVAADECTWFGVTCNAQHTAVEQLVLDNNNLNGPLSATLGNLSSLRVLILSSNRISGTVPAQLGALTSLNGDLALGNNQLSGSIPSQLGNLTNLKQLLLNDNQLSGGIPAQLGNLSSLQTLILGDNRLTGSIPPQLGALSNLEALILFNNQLSGSVPGQLGNLSNLRQLWLTNNELSGQIPSQLGGLSKLEYLVLSDNRLSGSIPAQLGNLGNLQYLWLQSNQLSGSIPTSLKDLDDLSSCFLHYNALFSNDAQLTSFLTARQNQNFGAWQNTQTVAPGNVSTSGATASTVTVTWTPIAYTSDNGSYRVHYSTNAGGPYSVFPTATPNKSAASLTVTGLAANTQYYFVVSTSTQSHAFNGNTVASGFSQEVSRKTADAGPAQPVANFSWSPTSPTTGQDVQFTDASSGTVGSWAWTFGDGDTSGSRNPKHRYAATGTYSVKLTVSNAGGSDSITRSVTVAKATCPRTEWSDLKLPTSEIGRELEAFHGDIPDPHPTLYAMISKNLDDRVRELETQVLAKAPTTVFVRKSGYRPPDYQDHLYQLKTLYEAMYKVRGTSVETQCASEIARVKEEKELHELGPQKPDGVEIPGTLAVNKRSNHEHGNALDVSVVPKPADWSDAVNRNNLHEPCSERAIHLQTRQNPVCGASTTVTAVAFVPSGIRGVIAVSSVPLVPLRILLRDPQGRRVGYDPVTREAMNEIGSAATYSGIESDPQVITVEAAEGGDYRVEAVAVSSGAYSLLLSADDSEHGTNFGSTSKVGNAVVGVTIEALDLDVQQTTPELQPGRRRAVRH